MDVADTLRHEFLADVAEAAERTALSLGIEADKARQVGCAVADMMCAEYPGIRIYIPQDKGFELAPRDQEIIELRGTGKSIPHLAKQFSVSEERIRQILKRRAVRDPGYGQRNLFDEDS